MKTTLSPLGRNRRLPRTTHKGRNAVVLAAAVALLAPMLPGCAVDPTTGQYKYVGLPPADPCGNSNAFAGALVGALAGVAGAYAAKALNHGRIAPAAKAGFIVGGAAIGAAIGHDVDRRRCEYAQIQKRYNLDIEVASIKASSSSVVTVTPPAPAQTAYTAPPADTAGATTIGLSVTVVDDGSQFASGSAELSPRAQTYFTELAQQYSFSYQEQQLQGKQGVTQDQRDAVNALRDKNVFLVGHTDDTGDSQLNADLSERRALAVAQVFAAQGIDASHIFYQGAGETLPIADNRTAEGRAKNRRVEIVDVTSFAAFKSYLASRTSDVTDFRPVTPHSRVPSQAPPVQVAAARANGAVPATATSRPRASTHQKRWRGFDFGGTPTTAQGIAARYGKPIHESSFSIFPTAYASESSLVDACTADRPRIADGVKSLANGQVINVSMSEYLPGLYGTSWLATLNGNLVGLRNVAVLRDGGSPAGNPDVLVYRHYRPGSNVRPDFLATAQVNTYRGDEALLYRVFLQGPITCMDIVFPYNNSGIADPSNLYYERRGTLLVVPFNPRVPGH
jgi:outer membrane protein OmpA-like peptidoglycan-associated protein